MQHTATRPSRHRECVRHGHTNSERRGEPKKKNTKDCHPAVPRATPTENPNIYNGTRTRESRSTNKTEQHKDEKSLPSTPLNNRGKTFHIRQHPGTLITHKDVSLISGLQNEAAAVCERSHQGTVCLEISKDVERMVVEAFGVNMCRV